jgi:hypothetical protein
MKSSRSVMNRTIIVVVLMAVLTFGSTIGLAVATSPAASASCSSNITSEYVYVTDGINSFAVSFPITYILASSVLFNPAAGSYYADQWSSGFDSYGSSFYFYWQYNKIANPGGAYFQVTHC